MRKNIVGAIVTGLLSVLVAVSPAQAGGTCTSGGAAGKPAALVGGHMALWNVKHTGYTGTPFSFQMVVKRGGFPDGYTYQTYTYTNGGRGYRYSMTTGAIRSGAVVRVRTWCGGIRGGDWTGWVHTR